MSDTQVQRGTTVIRALSRQRGARLPTLSATVITGETLVFATATSDIAEAGSITIKGTVRLGKKAGPYNAPFVFANGSVLEVFPDSDRAGAALNLTNQAFNATTTINVTSGTATVLVSSLVGIVAGAGVWLHASVGAGLTEQQFQQLLD